MVCVGSVIVDRYKLLLVDVVCSLSLVHNTTHWRQGKHSFFFLPRILGSVGQFDCDSDNWDSYCERFELYATANEIVDEGKHSAVFLSVCGALTYELIHSLVVWQRFHFNAHVQSENESVAQYVTELRRLAESCDLTLCWRTCSVTDWSVACTTLEHNTIDVQQNFGDISSS